MAYETIKYEVDDQILTITLNRPRQSSNAFNGTMQQETDRRVRRRRTRTTMSAPIIVTGRGARLSAPAPDLSSSGAKPRLTATARTRAGKNGLADGSVDYSDPGRCATGGGPGDAWRIFQVPQACHRGGERTGGRHRRHHAVGDGYPPFAI